MKSKMKIEKFAVLAIENEAIKFDLIPNIPVGDKAISFDGDIDVMKDDSEKKEPLIGKVPVQVKGNFVKKFSKGNRTFPLEIKDMKNFYDRNGAILFVVEVNEKMETKIFFKQLLPTELRLLINIYEGQKTRSIELRPLDETTLYRVCRVFLHESKRQAPILLESNPFNYEDYTSFKLSSTTFNPNHEATSNLYEHDFIMYGLIKNLSFPLGIARITAEIEEIKETLIIEGISTEVDMEITKGPEEVTMLIEKSIELKFTETGKFNFNFKKFRSITTQLKLLPILKSIFTEKKLHFLEQGAYLEGGKPHDIKWIEVIDGLYLRFLNLQKAFSLLKVKEDTEFPIEDDNFEKQIDAFTALVLENDFSRVNMVNALEVGFILYDLAGMKFTFFYNKDSDPPLINGFSEELIQRDTRVEFEGEIYPYSPYIKLNSDAMTFSKNIDFRVIKASFEQFDPFANEHIFGLTNHFCLLCVWGFDISQNVELLNLANYLYSKYETGLSKHSDIIIRINKLQINLRLNGSLTHEEMEELIVLKLSSKENEEIQFCTSVLLGSKTEADLFFKKINSEQQLFYEKMPIFHLFENM